MRLSHRESRTSLAVALSSAERVADAREMSTPRIASFVELATLVLARPARAGMTRAVGIDGPAGSGKTVFAERLAAALKASVICLDDLTPSWTGPDKEAELLVAQVLAPFAAGRDGRFHFFDWVADRYTEWRDVPRAPALIVEGVGAGSRIVRPYLSYLVWVEAPSALRFERGLKRDGQERLPEWERWRLREDALLASEGTRKAADLHIDGAPSVLHRASAEFVRLD